MVQGVRKGIICRRLPLRVLLSVARITNDSTHGPQLGQSTLRLKLRTDCGGQHDPLLLRAVDIDELSSVQLQMVPPCCEHPAERFSPQRGSGAHA